MEEDCAYNLLLARENSALAEAGFQLLIEEGDLWSRNGVLFGREAALQSALREMRDHNTEP
jgi:hypothetical protein